MNSERVSDILDRSSDEVYLFLGIFLVYIVLHFLFQRHELLAYDMYTYTSFAQHYADNWFHTLIPGQAHGLQIVSYPPLVFQVMALLSFIPTLDMVMVYILLTSFAATALSFSFYELLTELLDLDGSYRKFIVPLIAFSPGLMKFALVHGQLPLLVGMTFGFLGSSYFYRILDGKRKAVPLVVFVLLTAYTHHFSFLIMALLIVIISLMRFRELVKRLDYLVPPLSFAAFVAFLGLHPMIIETLFGISQGVIFHGSRDPLQGMQFFHQYLTTTYGLTIIGLFFVLKRNKRLHQANILALSFLTLGLGLITPTAEIIFGSMSDFLVYDRFSLVSSLFLVGMIGFFLSEKRREISGIDVVRIAAALFIILSLATTLWANFLHLDGSTGYGDYEPGRTQTAIEYLNNNASEDYLYSTFDHGLPVGEIRRNTDVPALDTGYYQGRKHGVGEGYGKFDRLREDQYWRVINNADNLSLKYVISFNESSDSLFSGEEWKREELDNNVTVWINKDVPVYEPDLGQRRILFTISPLLVLFSGCLLILCPQTGSRVERYFDLARGKIEKLFRRDYLRGWFWILALPLIAAAPSLLTSGYPSGIDTPAHIFKPELIAQMLEQHGQVFRWTTEWYNGYPFLSMYPPVFVYLLYGVSEVIGEMTLAYNLVRLVTITALSGVVYLLSANITAERRIRFLSAAFAVFSYPIYSNLYTVGRLASAMALPLYLFLVYLALRDDIFQKEVSRGHILLGVSAAMVFLLHSMMAYLFVFTALIFCIVYWRKVVEIGLKPVLVTLAVPLVTCFPYLARLVQHFSITDPHWYVNPVDLDLFEHLRRGFDVTPPSYSGWMQVVFFIIGTLKVGKLKDRFFSFSLMNFLFFYTAFWARNFRKAFFLPLSRQFDLSRFEILFTVFGIFIATYGVDYLYQIYLKDIESWKKDLLTVFLIGLLILGASPMFVQSMNWQPEFSGEMGEIEFEDQYRAMGVDMRQWHTYLLWEMGVPNTFGWFNQANPNPLYTQSLQRSGGRWFGWDFVQDISDSDYRKNLMELSNTRYIVSAEGDWFDSTKKMQVKGPDPVNHAYNEELIRQVQRDEEFDLKYSSQYLDVYELERDMSYCEGIVPVWIQGDYRRQAEDLLAKDRMLSEIPVKGTEKGGGAASNVTCSHENPYSISVETEEPGWVLVKESYYPFWERRGVGDIFNGFGFMVTYVEEDAELRYRPRNISTLELSDVKSFFDS